MKVRHFFTLIEMLVVIAIIAILASMLLPALGKAQIAARRVKCMGNQRQLVLVLMSYVDDYTGYFPPLKLVSGGDSLYYHTRELMTGGYLRSAGSTVRNDIQTDIICQCPENRAMFDYYTQSLSYTHINAVNAAQKWGTYSTNTQYAHHNPANYFAPLYIPALKFPAKCAMTADGIGGNHHLQSVTIMGFDHGGVCNVMFFDGHGEALRRGDVPLGKSANLVFFTGR